MLLSILLILALVLIVSALVYYVNRVRLILEPKEIRHKHLFQTLYTDKLKYVQGQPIDCYANSDVITTINIYILKEEKILVKSFENIPVSKQVNKYHPKNGCNWSKTLTIDTINFESGLYIIGIKEQTKQRESFFHAIIISPQKQQNKVAVFASTNTWLAYNAYGGQSNYLDYNNHILFKVPYKLMRKPVPSYLPTKRPHLQNPYDIEKDNYNYDNVYDSFDFAQHPRREWPLLAFLYKNDINFDIYSDWDLAYRSEIMNYERWIFNNHSEYWSAEMKGMLKKYIEKGGKVIIASGNNMFRDIEFYNEGIKMASQVSDIEITTKLTGSFFTEDGYLTLSNYKIIDKEHFAFKGINSAFFGEKSLYTYNGQTGASGIETDKINYFSDGFNVIAVGNNANGPSHMVFKQTEKGWVFNASSISFANSVLVDENCGKLFLNLLKN